MNDYSKLKDILEIAEVLSQEGDELEVQAVHRTTGRVYTVAFSFNHDGELTEVYVEG